MARLRASSQRRSAGKDYHIESNPIRCRNRQVMKDHLDSDQQINSRSTDGRNRDRRITDREGSSPRGCRPRGIIRAIIDWIYVRRILSRYEIEIVMNARILITCMGQESRSSPKGTENQYINDRVPSGIGGAGTGSAGGWQISSRHVIAL